MNVVEYKDVEILRKELVVLKHVDLVLKEGEFVYLIGRSEERRVGKECRL